MKRRTYSPIGELEVLVNGISVDKFIVYKNGKPRRLCVDDSDLLGKGIYVGDIEKLRDLVERKAEITYGLSDWRSLLYRTPKIKVNYQPHGTKETRQSNIP